MGGACSMHGKMRNVYTIFVRKLGERPLGRPRQRWKKKNGLKQIGWEGMDWIQLAQDRNMW